MKTYQAQKTEKAVEASIPVGKCEDDKNLQAGKIN